MGEFRIERGVLIKYEGSDECVRVPAGVRAIGEHAFYGSSVMRQVVLPDSVESIGDQAFGCCRHLNTVQLPSALKHLGRSVFFASRRLWQITIPNGVTVLREHMFDSCDSLRSVRLPAGLREIEDSAFFGCGQLQNQVLPDSLTRIGNWAFQQCQSLGGIDLPRGLKEIGIGAFRDSGVRRVDIPDGIRRIEEHAFSKCIYLTNVRIGSGVETIGAEAFETCRLLTSVFIPANVRDIAPGAFARCAQLSDLRIDANNRYLRITNGVMYTRDGNELIAAPRDLQRFEIPEGVQLIRRRAFSDCRELAEVSFPDSLRGIGEAAFDHCPIRSIRFERNAKMIFDALPGVALTAIATGDVYKVPVNLRPIAVRTFAMEDPADDDPRYECYDRYISGNIRRLAEYAAEMPELVRLICRRQLLTAADYECLFKAVSEAGCAESTARLLEYRQNVLGQGAFDRMEAIREKKAEQAFERLLSRTDRTDPRGLRFAARGKLSGYTNRAALKRALAAHGGILTDAITEKTDILITNEPDAMQKYATQAEFGMDVIDEIELRERFHVVPGDGRR